MKKEYEISSNIIGMFSAVGAWGKKKCSARESATIICEKGHKQARIGFPNRLQLELDVRQMSGIRPLPRRKNCSVR